MTQIVLQLGLILSLVNPFGLLGAALSAPHYSVTDLGTLGGGFSAAYGVNSSGQVAGDSLNGSLSYHAFLYSNGAMQDLGTLGGPQSFGLAINASGQVAGFADTLTGHHAFLWQNGTMQDLGTLGGLDSTANGINDLGQVTGQAERPGDIFDAFIWSNGTMTDLGISGGGAAINRSGQVAGTTGLPSRAFLYSGGQVTILGTLGGSDSQGNDINDAGQIVGNANVPGDSFHGFVWQNGRMRDLGLLPNGTNSYAYAINNLGQVVGVGMIRHNGQLVNHAVLWMRGHIADLNQRIPAGSGWELNDALAISEDGKIAGFGVHNGQTRAFLLTPQ